MYLHKLRNFELISTVFIMILGIVLHFLYQWSSENYFVGYFSAVNESICEHLKLLFFPFLITIILGRVYFKNEYDYYFCNKTKGLIVSLLFIVVFFYTYSGVLGKNVDFVNIISFFVAVIIGQFYSYKNNKDNAVCNNFLALFSLVILFVMFLIFTYNAPNLGIFNVLMNLMLDFLNII